MKLKLTKLAAATLLGASVLSPSAASAYPPTITQQPANQAVLVGSNASFSVVASGTLPLSYQWRSSCGALPDATNSTLALTNVTTNLSGCTYWVEVTNASGVVTSSVVTLAVVYPGMPDTFNPGADYVVSAMAVQPDGRILVGGGFGILAGQSCSCLGRLNADGTLDSSFNPGAGNCVNCLAVYPDGRILVGGTFNMLHVRV